MKKNEELTVPVKHAKSPWLEKALERKKNADWLRLSSRVAFNVLSLLRQRNMSKTELAERMEVTPQYVSKLVKGQENLTLSTIAKLQRIFNVDDIVNADYSEVIEFHDNWAFETFLKTVEYPSSVAVEYKKMNSAMAQEDITVTFQLPINNEYGYKVQTS